jgi:hypothetical protein
MTFKFTPEQRNNLVVGLEKIFEKNEINKKETYTLKHASGGNSGYSFGASQWDVKNNDEAKAILKAIGVNAALIQKMSGSATLTNTEISEVNTLISAPNAKKIIDKHDKDHMNNQLIGKVEHVINHVTHPERRAWLIKNQAAQLMIADMANQYKPEKIEKLIQFINTGHTQFTNQGFHKGVSVDIVNIGQHKELGIVDLYRFRLATQYARDSEGELLHTKTQAGAYDVARRTAVILKYTGSNVFTDKDRAYQPIMEKTINDTAGKDLRHAADQKGVTPRDYIMERIKHNMNIDPKELKMISPNYKPMNMPLDESLPTPLQPRPWLTTQHTPNSEKTLASANAASTPGNINHASMWESSIVVGQQDAQTQTQTQTQAQTQTQQTSSRTA